MAGLVFFRIPGIDLFAGVHMDASDRLVPFVSVLQA